MSNILAEIVEVKKEEVVKLRRDFSISRFSDYEFFSKKTYNFLEALTDKRHISIIAEIKKASPSKGIIRKDFNPLAIADIYMNNGASAISILTDEKFFMGNIDYLNQVAQIKSIPLLRKDFLIDEYQVYEAKANGADAILLITEILSENQIKELTSAAYELGMNVLLELHSEKEFGKIDFELNKIIGINNRDLSNFKTDLKTTEEISSMLNNTKAVVSESGISNKNDFDFLKSLNIDAVLIGEQFMKSDSIETAIKEIKEFCYYEN